MWALTPPLLLGRASCYFHNPNPNPNQNPNHNLNSNHSPKSTHNPSPDPNPNQTPKPTIALSTTPGRTPQGLRLGLGRTSRENSPRTQPNTR